MQSTLTRIEQAIVDAALARIFPVSEPVPHSLNVAVPGGFLPLALGKSEKPNGKAAKAGGKRRLSAAGRAAIARAAKRRWAKYRAGRKARATRVSKVSTPK